jgi:pyridoxal phosphate enzyme (YggS family)
MMEKSYLDKRKADIEYNLDVINEKIAESAIKSGRKPSDIQLMAVTKTVDPIFINYALDYGVNMIGENRVQEMLRKKPDLHLQNVQKHLIGHLQTNKAGQIVGEVDMIQSVDSLKIAKEIAKQSAKKGITTDVLLEINIGDEESKTGFSKSEFMENLYQIAEIPQINVKGLMTIPPICDNDVILREFFENIYNIYVDIKGKKLDNISMNILSMGMSGDYEQAILCGSNLVRIGSSIFGPRIY